MVLSVQRVLGMLIALLLDDDAPGYGLLRALLMLTLVIPPAIIGMMFLLLEDPQFGVITYVLESIGILDNQSPILATASTALMGVMLAAGEAVRLRVAPEKLHVFDAKTGRRL